MLFTKYIIKIIFIISNPCNNTKTCNHLITSGNIIFKIEVKNFRNKFFHNIYWVFKKKILINTNLNINLKNYNIENFN